MRSPTPEQQAVLDDTSRIRVVRAVPGSGKTWLVAELIRRELADWPRNGKGIAAISFTKVGGAEIRSAVGHELGHPHFVGTIDAFMFRYVVRPFLARTLPTQAPPRLIPAEWSPGKWKKGPSSWSVSLQGAGGRQGKHYNLLELCYVGEDSSGPLLAHPKQYGGGIEPVANQDRATLMSAKDRSWKRHGWLTHADAALLASTLLNHVAVGAAIRSLLAQRFPLLIVDELQDTGYFLGKCIHSLLAEASIRALLVGDPDQAIFEFNGARPALFDGFDRIQGARSLPLSQSRRCPAAIAACAAHLKDTPGSVTSSNTRSGNSLLVRYKDMTVDMRRLTRAIREARPSAHIKTVVRSNNVISELTAGKGEEVKSLHSPALVHIARAVQEFRCGHQIRALASARALIDLAVFEEEGLSDDDLSRRGVDPAEWKALAIKCLIRANALDSNLSMQDWQRAAGTLVDSLIQAVRLPSNVTFATGKLKPKNLTGTSRQKAKADKTFSSFAPAATQPSEPCATPIETVHAVKGETHDITLLVIPDTRKVTQCPSETWWSTDPDQREERRIAYVAMTRTCGDLVVCVSEACDQRLQGKRAQFTGSFLRQTVDECIGHFTA